jgi:hypothetical protein
MANAPSLSNDVVATWKKEILMGERCHPLDFSESSYDAESPPHAPAAFVIAHAQHTHDAVTRSERRSMAVTESERRPPWASGSERNR